MRLPRVSPRTYRGLTLAALVLLVAIVITGALVRLTESGLGCSDWPNCNEQKFIDVSSWHAGVEQVNRLFTGLVGVAVIAAVLGSLLRTPRRRDLTWLSVSLVIGVIGQALVGAIVIYTDLHPAAVQQHFLLSMVLLAAALTLHRRAKLADGDRRRPVVGPATARWAWVIAVLGAAALVTGTVVTGTGPHSGSHDGEPVRRWGFEITAVARVHGITVLMLLAVVVYVIWRTWRTPDRRALEPPLTALIVVGLLQASIGYIQYLNDVPVALVGIHVFLACLVWLATVNVVLHLREGRAPARGMVDFG
jgi:cytochrome c oxidase assembly protein subunit 15